MATILQHLSAIFNPALRSVLNDPLSIALIDNPSEKVQLAAIQGDKNALLLIKSPSEKVLQNVVKRDPSYLGLVDSSIKVQVNAIESNPYNIFYLKNPSKEAIQTFNSSGSNRNWIAQLLNREPVSDNTNPVNKSRFSLEQSITDYRDTTAYKEFSKEYMHLQQSGCTKDEYTNKLYNILKKYSETTRKDPDVSLIIEKIKSSNIDYRNLNPKVFGELLNKGKTNIGSKLLTMKKTPVGYIFNIMDKVNQKATQAQAEL